MRPSDLDRALSLFRQVFGDVTVMCSFCREEPAASESTWCRDCDDLFAEHVAPVLDGGLLVHFGGELPAGEVHAGPVPDGVCGWCAERPVEDGSRLCSECASGTRDTASIGVPLTDRRVRALGFVPTARGWVPRTQDLRERLEAADRARTAQREVEDERDAAIRRVIRRLKGRPA